MSTNPLLRFLSTEAQSHYQNAPVTDLLDDYTTNDRIHDSDKFFLGSIREAISQYRVRPAYSQITSSNSAKEFAQSILTNPEQEELAVIVLDTKNQILGHSILFKGTLNQSVAHPREILRYALRYPSARFLIAHSHPSGNPEPSHADIQFTRRIEQAGDIMGIGLLDHIVVGVGKEALSMKEEGSY